MRKKILKAVTSVMAAVAAIGAGVAIYLNCRENKGW